MSTPADEVAVDVDALDAKAAAKAAEADKTATKDSPIVVDDELSAKAAESKVVTPEDGIAKLQKQLKDERDARIAAENRATEAARGEAEAKTRAQTSDLDVVKGAIAQMTMEADALEAKYAEAFAAQDGAALAKIQRQMTANAAKLDRLEAGKAHLERQPKPTPRTPIDPVDAFCAQLTVPSAAWVRAHPEFVRDAHKNRQMIAAHELAVARGYKVDTDDYFKSIEKTLDIGAPVVASAHADDPEAPTAETAAAASGGRQVAPAAAPVTRSANGAAGRPGVVRLSRDEVEMAQNMGMSVEEYARNKVALKKEGKLS